ncbi:hypothetical protein L5515_010623 [Caenorhabditis briggsae]|uniref:AMP-activated protein kinase glycogen-binding domain-containing protein n=1 Tax=Caenorhabditis briggsae TaxID=6238 RepID=A0AAE9JEC4_CAEBR|nr:hypothetical protein L5515_010623 [Caenorhabditis briggsae]
MIGSGQKTHPEDGSFSYGIADFKRFFQWVLGCTYAKKTIRTRISEMFHFADAPHIVVYERSEERPWYWMVAIITAVLVAVLSLYYTVEAGFRAIRKFIESVLREPIQSTVSTPRCLSPTTPSSKKTSPQTPKTPDVIVRQKMPMNEPVNCVFIRPAAPKSGTVAVPNLNSEEDVTVEAEKNAMRDRSEKKEKEKRDKKKSPPTQRLEEVKFDASSNVNVIPTMAPPPQVNTAQSNTPIRKSTGSEELNIPEASTSEFDQTNEWVMRQIAGCRKLSNENSHEKEKRENAGACVIESEEPMESGNQVTGEFLGMLQQIIEAQLGESGALASSNENLSEMSASSIISSLVEIEETEPSFSETQKSSSSEGENLELQTADADDVDIVIDDSHLTAETRNECSGSVLIRSEKEKVLFRWTDIRPETIDSITLTGSFFGWNMSIPMKGIGQKMFEVCVDLPAGVHDYSIEIFRFDS